MALEKLVIHSTETPFGIEVDLESIESEHLEKGFKNYMTLKMEKNLMTGVFQTQDI